MPPRVRYTRDLVLDAALALCRRDGVAAVSARAVAAELGCSTAPVFSAFESMDALHEALIDRVIELFVGFFTHDGPDPLLEAGLGMARFASEEPSLYAALFLSHHDHHGKWGPVRRDLARRMGEHPRYADLPERARFALVGRASIVAHGVGVEVWSGRLPGLSEASLRQLIEQLANPLIDASIANGWTSDLHSEPHPRTP